MTRTALLAATVALLMTGGAFAQDPPAPAAGDALPPPPELAPGAPAPDADAQAAGSPASNVSPTPEAGADAPPSAAEVLEEVDRMRDRRERREHRRGMRDRRPDRMGRSGEYPEHDEEFEWRDHHAGMMMHGMRRGGRGGPQGAVFRFSRGPDGPSIVIRCADRDTTQQCVDAVRPMLQMMLPNVQ